MLKSLTTKLCVITGLFGLTGSALADYDNRFNTEDELDSWIIVNDTVMGGRSSASLEQTQDGLQFSGNISFANNGGFASARRKLFNDELAGCDHIQLLFKADDRRYKLRLRNTPYIDGSAYEVDFKASKEPGWQMLRFHKSDFQPYFRGRKLSRQAAFEFSDAKQLIIMAADKRAGAFDMTLGQVLCD